MTDDAPVTAAGWEERAHPRGEHGKFRKLDEIMGDLGTAARGAPSSGTMTSASQKVSSIRVAINRGKRAQARTELKHLEVSTNSPEVKALAQEAQARLQPVKVSKGVGEAKPGFGAVVHQVHHPDHGHIGSIEKHIDEHHVTAPGQRISIGTTQSTSYRAIPKGVNPYSPRARSEGGVQDFRTRAQAEHHLAEHADAKAIAAQGAAGGSDNQPQTPSVADPTDPSRFGDRQGRLASEFDGVAPRQANAAADHLAAHGYTESKGGGGVRVLTAPDGSHQIRVQKTGTVDRLDKGADGQFKPSRSYLAGTNYDSTGPQIANHVAPEVPVAPPSAPAPRGDTPHGNAPGSPYEPLGNARPDVAVIPEGQLVPDHVNSNFKGSLFDRQGNRFYRAQSGDVMADRPHDGEAPNSNIRKLEHATPEEQAAFERASGGDSTMGGGPGTPAWDRMMPSEVQTGDTIAHPASNRPIKVNNVVQGPHGVTVTHDDNGTERNVLLPHQTPVARILSDQTPADPRAAADQSIEARRAKTAAIIKEAADKYVATGDAKHLETIDRARAAEQAGYQRDVQAYVPEGANVPPARGIGQMERDAAAATPAASAPEISRAQEVAGERRDVAAANAESIAGENLPKGYGIVPIGINAGPNNPSGTPAFMPVHNADGAIGAPTTSREEAKQAIRDHAASRMRGGADALRQAEATGHVGNADPAALAKRRSDGELQKMARDMPNTPEGRVAQAELDRRANSGSTSRPATIMNKSDTTTDNRAIMQKHDVPTLQRMASDGNLRQQDRQMAHDELARRGIPAASATPAPAAPAPSGTSRRSAANKPVGSIVHVRQPGGTQRLGTVTAVDGQHRHVELNPIGGGTQKQKIRIHASQITPVENGPAPSRPVASPGGRSAKAQRAFQAASEGDHAWLAGHGFNAAPGDKIHVDDSRGIMAFQKPDGRFHWHGVNGNGQASGGGQAPSLGMVAPGARVVHEPRTGGTAMPTGSAPDGGVSGTQSSNPGAKAMTERILANRAAGGGVPSREGRKPNAQNTLDAIASGDTNRVKARGLDLQPGDTVSHAPEQRFDYLKVNHADGSTSHHMVDGTGRITPVSIAPHLAEQRDWQPIGGGAPAANRLSTGDTFRPQPQPGDRRKPPTADEIGLTPSAPAAGLDKYGVPADKTNQQLGSQMPTLPVDHRQIADSLKAKYMVNGPEHDRGISDDLRRYYLLNNQGGRDDEAAYWLRSAEEQAASKAPGAEANREGGITTAYEPVPPRAVNGSDLKSGDIFKVTKKRYLNTGGDAPVDNPDQLYRVVEGGGYSNSGDPTYEPIDQNGNPTGRRVKMMGLYTTAQVVGKDRASGPKA